jgi:hypothetical protein
MMIDETEIDERKVCYNCVGEKYLRSIIKNSGSVTEECFYCKGNLPAITLADLSIHIERALSSHFQKTAPEPDYDEQTMQRHSDYEWERRGDRVGYIIEEVAQLSEIIAEDARRLLEDKHYDFDAAVDGEENPFEEEACYEDITNTGDALEEEWNNFIDSLKCKSRFFSSTGEKTLQKIFGDLSSHYTATEKPVVIIAGPKKRIKSLYRARVFQSQADLDAAIVKPDFGVGPPPSHLARAGRMNAHGISVFYGAQNAKVALSEVRPPVGSSVIVARFNLVRNVRLLDIQLLGQIEPEGSPFDPSHRDNLDRATFLKNLEHFITMPVMPNHEALEYLPTQAIADFLSNTDYGNLDGIIYRSVQSKSRGRNIVLFNRSSILADLEWKIKLQDNFYCSGEDSEIEGQFHKEIRLAGRINEEIDLFEFLDDKGIASKALPTLRLDFRSIVIHTIGRVDVISTPHRIPVKT